MADEANLPRIYHPDTVQPAPSRLYFFDANVWLEVISPPLSRRTFMRPYMALWRRLQEAGQPCIVANAVLVSEIMNRFLRLRFDVWREAPGTLTALQASGDLTGNQRIDFKRHFRGSEPYKDALNQFLAAWDEVSYFVTYLQAEVESSIVPAMLLNYGKQSDFNDKYYAEFCKAHGLWLVSHDGDFYVGGLNVVTANEESLAKYEEMKRRQR
ncbi:hypothetical protein [Hymenobacter weizhouensis]|uniref:hypothetical protein n=1 Tax=Hymenobacter sp. YIM 151500-1 TaxID=2987689 RepID=UPI00222630F8|nr:hypothetical protein [Hymenobacter sp. YIM 151500-1]UYZ64921.1 hypothetical protein OIS53_08725 [Hymenobacter sp. YIM 151500-1]